ncbi:WecB/TagA/CpsF family glycosyltransferase [Rhodococcus rhodochrous]|uniref:WecB/TagA/CpsF family glycosyltransferase n=1 Tax=Rhodococcus rhodochrous TaxID=1829 RepID=UPI001E3D2EBA|nr:WecB/TagA/CpsF family glycosyltransferase [Rhodococcus rhodochrous]MCB8910109.1 WecB/TagA/CpsF family glycosyltransferase [Rhodococcus rhodochrous]
MVHNVNANSRSTIRVGKIDFTVGNLDLATDEILLLCKDRISTAVRLANAYCVAYASQDVQYESLLREGGITYPDGKPVVWFMKLFRPKGNEPRQVRGPSLFLNVMDKGREQGIKHFFLGTDVDTLDRLQSRMLERFPGLKVAGMFAPPFSPITPESIAEMSQQIDQASPDIVWVALGTPKQDFVASALSSYFAGPLVAVGAAFDFAAGTRREAPLIVQRLALEWFFRFVSEPRRLWKRYTIDLLRFLITAVRDSDSTTRPE